MTTQIPYQSYRSDYSKAELSNMVLMKQPLNRQPACPLCRSKQYVKQLTIGLVDASDYISDDLPEERRAPLTCIYEGFDWDCTQCMIKFQI